MPIAQDTDLGSLATERAIEAELGNPLKAAIQNLSGREEEAGDDTEETEESLETENTEETEETSEETTEETEETEEVTEEETEGEEAEQPEGKTTKLATLDIPMPNADGSKGPRGTGKIKLDGVPQEAADAMRHYIKQADKLPLVEQQLVAAQEGAQIADFIEADPFSALVMIGNAVPDAVDEFIKSYIQMNPAKVAKMTEELELADMSERELKLAAKVARKEAEERAVKSYQAHAGKYATQKQADSLIILAQELAATANVPEDEMEEFMFLASRKVAKLYQANPRITHREVVAGLQPVVAKYAKAPTKEAPKAKGSAKVFTAKVKKAQKFSVVGSGKAAIKPVGGLKRAPKGTTTSQAIKLLSQGKLG